MLSIHDEIMCPNCYLMDLWEEAGGNLKTVNTGEVPYLYLELILAGVVLYSIPDNTRADVGEGITTYCWQKS